MVKMIINDGVAGGINKSDSKEHVRYINVHWSIEFSLMNSYNIVLFILYTVVIHHHAPVVYYLKLVIFSVQQAEIIQQEMEMQLKLNQKHYHCG